MLTVNVIVIKFNYFIVIIFRRRIVVVVPINFVGKFALFLLDKYFLCSHNINNDQMIMSTCHDTAQVMLYGVKVTNIYSLLPRDCIMILHQTNKYISE